MTVDNSLVGFSFDQAARVTGLTRRQLAYWEKTGFFRPTVHQTRRAFGRVYTFRDVVGLRTIAILRNVHKLPLQELRRVGAWLVQHHETPWASLTLYVAGKAVLFEDPGSGQILSTRDGGQSVLRIELERVASQTREELAGLKARAPSEIGAIMQNRYVVRNLPVVAGTRVPTAAVWNLHSGGYSPADIIKEFPRLTAKDVAAAIEFERTRRAEAAV